ncbi:MAG: hypothetical protein AAGA09_05620 [Pseudomonadota bacterium]
MQQIVFATCNAAPDLQPGDRLVAAALERGGVRVVGAPWNGDPAAFRDADLVVVRSTWDYHEDADGFRAWIGDLASGGVRLLNSARLLRWNISKSYLLDLATAGAPLPPTLPVEPTATSIAAAMKKIGVEDLVVKPLIGATASGLSRVRAGDEAAIEAAAVFLGGAGIVQPLIREVETEGETSFIFFDGVFSHAVVKHPKTGDIRVQEEHGGRADAISPPAGAVAEMRSILDLLPELPVYARIDAILLDAGAQLMEVEVIEPELFFTKAPAGADRFADALRKRLK